MDPIYCDGCNDETSFKDASQGLEIFGTALCYDCQKLGATHTFVCNGYNFRSPQFNPVARRLAIRYIHEERPLFNKLINDERSHDRALGPDLEMYEGWRFNDDSNIIIRIESKTTERDFMMFPRSWVQAALKDAAQSDYWYQYEKDWG